MVLKATWDQYTSNYLLPSGEFLTVSTPKNVLNGHTSVTLIARFSQLTFRVLRFRGCRSFLTDFSCRNYFYLKIARCVL